AARVVGEHAVLRLVPLDLAIPHAYAARERVAEHEPGRGVPVAMDFVIGLDAVDGRFHAVSTIKGIIISSAVGPPWLPMCKWRGSPAVQSFTVWRPFMSSATSPTRSAKRGCASPGPNQPSPTRSALDFTSARSPSQPRAFSANAPLSCTWQ